MASDKGRQFIVKPMQHPETGELFYNRDEALQAAADMEAVLFRNGGGFVVSSIRRKVPNLDPITAGDVPEEFVTVGLVFRHVYTPHVERAPEPDPHFTAVSTEPDEMLEPEGYEQFAADDVAIAEGDADDVPPGLEEQTTALDRALEGIDAGSPAA